MLLVVEVAKYLHSLGIVKFDENGVTGNTFISVMPSGVDKNGIVSKDICVALFPSGGVQSDSKLAYKNPTFQMLVRGSQDPRPAMELSERIYDALHGFSGKFTPDGVHVVSCFGLQSAPTYIGQDDNKRHEYSMNFILETKQI